MMPPAVKTWLADYLSEDEVKARIGGSRQNWAVRRPKIRDVAGLEVKPGVWFYHAQTLAQFLAEREKYKPISMNGD